MQLTTPYNVYETEDAHTHVSIKYNNYDNIMFNNINIRSYYMKSLVTYYYVGLII